MTDPSQSTEWVPLTARDTPQALVYHELADGVPDWLERSLWRWVMDRAALGGADLVFEAERRLRVQIQRSDGMTGRRSDFDLYWERSDDRGRLNLIDFLLHHLQLKQAARGTPSELFLALDEDSDEKHLDRILTEGGSLWQVSSSPHWGLTRRVNEISQTQANLATSPQTDAARRLASAWNACYRQDPDYDIAYRDAVLAIEAVVIPVTVPKSSRATLGTAIAHISNTVSDWTVGDLEATEQASGDTLLAMLRTVWHNQQRHAETDGTIVSMTQREAEAAVNLSVTLVHWFASGLAHHR